MTTYSERLDAAKDDIDEALEREGEDLDLKRFVREEAYLLTPGDTYETLLVASEMLQAGDVSIPWELIEELQGYVGRGMRHRFGLLAREAMTSLLRDRL